MFSIQIKLRRHASGSGALIGQDTAAASKAESHFTPQARLCRLAAGAAVGFLVFMVSPSATRAATQALGIDVSNYQGTINWNSVAGTGISFAWAKATEGV